MDLNNKLISIKIIINYVMKMIKSVYIKYKKQKINKFKCKFNK
jgi:hypothetical protein